jgi:hypothetical protein
LPSAAYSPPLPLFPSDALLLFLLLLLYYIQPVATQLQRERLQRPTNPTNPQTLDPYAKANWSLNPNPYAKANWSLNPNPYSQSGMGPEVRLRYILVLSMIPTWINK